MKLLKKIKMFKKSKGFTLVELIVVIAIIGILAAVLIPSITGYIKDARVSADEQEATAIYRIYQNYVLEINEESYERSFKDYYLSITSKALPDGWKAYGGSLNTNLFEVVEENYSGYSGIEKYEKMIEETVYFIFEGNFFNLIDAIEGTIVSSGEPDNSKWVRVGG